MLTYDEAVARILAIVQPLGKETAFLEQALGHVIATDVLAPLSLPPFDNSAMDGFALRAEDVMSASEANPTKLKVINEIQAGQFPTFSIKTGECAQIYTGAVIPNGADAVVPIEDVTNFPDESLIILSEPVFRGQFIRRAGSDIEQGAYAIESGKFCRAFELAMAAALGLREIIVHRKPKIALIVTGDELTSADGIHLKTGQIFDSNTAGVSAQVRSSGAEITHVFRASDTIESVRGALNSAIRTQADIVVTTGGVSVGAYDFVKASLSELGGEIDFWRVAIRPGKPLVFGNIAEKLYFGLPGNPVSAMVTFELFVRPAIKRMMGFAIANCQRVLFDAKVTREVSHEPGRRSFQRAWSWVQDGKWHTEPVHGQGSHELSGLVNSNSLIVVPEAITGIESGSEVSIMLLN